MLHNRLFPLLIAITVTSTPVVAFGQQQRVDPTINGNYRDGQPMVMTPPSATVDPSSAIRGRFLAAYTRAKSPRIVIFWNREFSDQVASEYEDYATLDSNTSENASATVDAYRKRRSIHAQSEVEGSSTTSAEVRAGTHRIDDANRGSDLSEAIDFDVQSAFQGSLTSAGARLIDRASIMRSTGAAKKVGARGNVQEVETDAILARTDIVVEIVRMSDDRAADGVKFRVIARDVRNARILASFTTDGRPPVGRQPYVAGPNGFERARPPVPGPSAIGRQLALDTMVYLTGAL